MKRRDVGHNAQRIECNRRQRGSGDGNSALLACLLTATTALSPAGRLFPYLDEPLAAAEVAPAKGGDADKTRQSDALLRNGRSYASGTNESVVRDFLRSLTDEDWDTRFGAAKELLLNKRDLIGTLVNQLRKEAYPVRSRATWAVASAVGSTESDRSDEAYVAFRSFLPNLLEIARDRDPMDRGLAGAWIGKVLRKADVEEEHRQRAIAVLEGLLSDPCDYVRGKTATEMVGMGSIAKPLVPHLAALLEDPEYVNRLFACGVLETLGPEAKAAVPALLKKMDSPALRHRAERAIKKIDPYALPDTPKSPPVRGPGLILKP